MNRLKAKGLEEIVYESVMPDTRLFGSEVIRDLADFKARTDLIAANRLTADLEGVAEQVFTRDLFGGD